MSETTNKSYNLPTVGGNFGTWGTLLNQNFDIIDSNLGGLAVVSVGGNTNVAASPSQAQNLIQQLTGALTGNIQYLLPEVGGLYEITNSTTGSFSISVGVGITSAIGNTVVVPTGATMLLLSDGTNVFSGTGTGWQEIATYSEINVTSFAFPLFTSFRRFRLTMNHINTSASSAVVGLQFSADGGSTYQSSNYSFAISGANDAGQPLNAGGSGQSSIPVVYSSAAGFNLGDGTFEIFPGSTGTTYPTVRGSLAYEFSSGNFVATTVGGVWLGSGTLMNYAKLSVSSGTFTANLILEGLP